MQAQSKLGNRLSIVGSRPEGMQIVLQCDGCKMTARAIFASGRDGQIEARCRFCGTARAIDLDVAHLPSRLPSGCPKCGHPRGADACAKCGLVYKKWQKWKNSKDHEAEV